MAFGSETKRVFGHSDKKNAQSGNDKDRPGSSMPDGGELRAALRASTGAFTATGIFSFFINLLMLTGPIFMLQIYDRVLTSHSIPTLIALFLLVTGLFAILGILELVRSRILVRIGVGLDRKLNDRVFGAVARRTLNPATGAPFANALGELGILRQFLTGSGPAALFDAPWVPFYIAIIFLFHWTLGLVAVMGALALFAIALATELLARKPMADANIAQTKSAHRVTAARKNAEVMAAMGMMENVRAIWRTDHDAAITGQAQASDRTGGLTALSKSLRLFLQSAILAVGAVLAIQQVITPGVMIAASIILGRALQPVEQAIGQWRGFIRARQSYNILRLLLDTTPEPAARMELPRPQGQLDVKALRVAAPGTQTLILNGVSFGLKPGQVLGIIGPSGSGKSTLARGLVGVWPPIAGEVRLDGATLSQWHPNDLGRHIGYLPQDVELFDGTVEQNIARFQSEPEAGKVVEAAKRAGVHDLILTLPDGYETILGEGGSNLSAGQRQRIALARALFDDPVLVVLDEPNSNLDGSGDEALTQAIHDMRARKQTVVVISHRTQLLTAVDFLLVLEAGQQQIFGPRDQVVSRLAGQQPRVVATQDRKQAK